MARTKPCSVPNCGHPKKAGHPRLCFDHWLVKKPIEFQVEQARLAREQQEGRWRALYEQAGAEYPERLPRPHRSCWPIGRAWCSGCLRFRRTWFFTETSTRCRPCASSSAHRSMVARTYGEDVDYDAMFAAQGGTCAICRKRQLIKRLAVHHDHVTGEVVGLLCQRCNHDLLGSAFDSPAILLRAYALQLGGWEAVEKVLRLQADDVTWDPTTPAPF